MFYYFNILLSKDILLQVFSLEEANEQTSINGGMLIKKKKYKSIKNKQNKSSRNITLMVIFQCVLNTFGMCPYFISYILSFFIQATPGLEIFTNISYGILYLSHGLTLFINLAFNKLFAQVLIRFMLQIFRKIF